MQGSELIHLLFDDSHITIFHRDLQVVREIRQCLQTQT